MKPFDEKDLFDSGGHLSDAGLNALREGTLSELARLDAAEHLTWCDQCLERYTAFAEQGPLGEPEHNLMEPVERKLRMHRLVLFSNRYLTLAAAILLAFGLWNFGLFGAKPKTIRPVQEKVSASFSQVLSGAIQSTQNTFTSLFSTVQGQVANGLKQLTDTTPKKE
jgi:cytoskeletal protein RodZ